MTITELIRRFAKTEPTPAPSPSLAAQPAEPAIVIEHDLGGWEHVSWPRVFCLTAPGNRLPQAVSTRFGRYVRVHCFRRPYELYAALQRSRSEGADVAAIVIDLTLPDFAFLVFAAGLLRDRLAPNADIVHVGHGAQIACFERESSGELRHHAKGGAELDRVLRNAIERRFVSHAAA